MRCIIVGSGPVGLSIAEELHAKSHECLVVNRSGVRPQGMSDGIEYAECDANDTARIADLLKGRDIVVHAAGVPYSEWEKALPPLLESLIDAAAQTGASLLYLDSMLAYGDNAGIPISEATPEKPLSKAATLRSKLARRVIEADRPGKSRTMVLRGADIYGPRVENSPLGTETFEALIADKAIPVFGRLDVPHTFTFVKDFGRSAALISEYEAAWGKVWHAPSPQPITQQQVLDNLRDLVNRALKWKLYGPGVFGWSRRVKNDTWGIQELFYQYDRPFVINHSRFAANFGERTTPHEQGLWETLEWFRRRAGIVRRFGV